MSDYKLVPVEPTPEMRRKAGLSRGADYYTITKVWRAMLDAAPQPPHGAHVMSDPVIRRVRRSIDEAKNRGGMRVGMPKVTIDASDAERLCIMAEALAAAPAVQEEPVAFCEDAALSIAERTFSTEVDERLASDIIQYAQRLHSLYTAPQPAEHHPECGCCGQTDRCDDDCDAVEQQPDVAQLAEIAKDIVDLHDRRRVVLTVHVEALREALAAYRKGGDE